MINYSHFKFQSDVDQYCQDFVNGYYRFCGVGFPVHLNGAPIERLEPGATIHRSAHFTAYNI